VLRYPPPELSTDLLQWKNKKELTYKLLSDPQSKLIKALGAFVLPNK
jgi:peroxiredoxin